MESDSDLDCLKNENVRLHRENNRLHGENERLLGEIARLNENARRAAPSAAPFYRVSPSTVYLS